MWNDRYSCICAVLWQHVIRYCGDKIHGTIKSREIRDGWDAGYNRSGRRVGGFYVDYGSLNGVILKMSEQR